MQPGGRTILLCLALLLPGAAEAACPALAESHDALAAGDLYRLQQAAEAADRPGACRSIEIDQVRRWLALGIRGKALAEADSLAEAEPMLTEAAAISEPWQVLVTLGDAARARRDYMTADHFYQDALADIAVLANPASPYWDKPPAPELAQAIKRKADSMRLAAPGFQRRQGRPACQIQTAGMWAAQIVVPIRFETGRTDFTRDGVEAAEDLAACIGALDPAKVRAIVIAGHTDPRGTEAYNQDLSERRAQAVRDYLRQKGLKLPYETVGHGETQPFQPDDPDFYSEDTRFQMDRRVEVDVQTDGS